MSRENYQKNKEPCRDKRGNCKCERDGYCLALSDTDFGSRPCPFYAAKEENREEAQEE